jgi:hypothetical protein
MNKTFTDIEKFDMSLENLSASIFTYKFSTCN